jgi:hypothetical protein
MSCDTNTLLQVLVINAVKDVAAALTNLISTTKHASGKSLSDPAMQQLKDAAKVCSPLTACASDGQLCS